MLKTVKGEQSLVSWGMTKNRTQVATSDIYERFIRNQYIKLFEQIRDTILNKGTKKFCTTWCKLCSGYTKTFISDIIKINKGLKTEAIRDIWNKFRGNLGEIFVEKLINEGVFRDYLCRDTYTLPEDRDNEDFTDATAIDFDGFKVGVQIKNHRNPVTLDTFIKAGDMDSRFMREVILENGDLQKYLDCPRQYIISFTDMKDTIREFHEEYYGRVRFIGPYGITETHSGNSDENIRVEGLDTLLALSSRAIVKWIDDIISEILETMPPTENS